jgi:hypothetical protein
MNVNNCHTCDQPISLDHKSLNFDFGDDCLSCMARHDDPDVIKAVEGFTGEKVNALGSS